MTDLTRFHAFARYMGYRALAAVPTILGLITLTFVLSHIVPGNPALVIIGPEVNAQELKIAEAEMGLNKPLYIQYFDYLGNLFHGNLGYSYVLSSPISTAILGRFASSIELAIAAIAVGIPIALFLGIATAKRVNKPFDHAVRVLSLLGISMPVFWLGEMEILLFYLYLRILPASGEINPLLNTPNHITGMFIVDSALTGNLADLISSLRHIILPALALSIFLIAFMSRIVRSGMLEVLGTDHIRTAAAIGLPTEVVVYKYALRNALLPAITVAAIYTAGLMGGVVLTESVFGWPGVGWLTYYAIQNLDYPTIMGVVLLSGILFVVMNFIADILYAVVDPRVTL